MLKSRFEPKDCLRQGSKLNKISSFDPRIRKITWRRKWQRTPAFLPGESRGQTSLVDYQRVGHDWAYGKSHILLPRMLSPSLGRSHPAPRQQNFFLSELFHLLKEQVHSLSLLSFPLPPYFSLPLVNIPYSALPLLSFRFCSPTFLYASTCNILQKNSSEHFAQPSILAALCL